MAAFAHDNRKKIASLCIVSAFIAVLMPDIVWAAKMREVEGVISHQIGHFLFIIGMLVLFYRLNASVSQTSGWIEFKIFIVLVILWNLVMFYGHLHSRFVNPDKFVIVDGTVKSFAASSLSDVFFYLSRLDSLLLVPAFCFLLRALCIWRKEA